MDEEKIFLEGLLDSALVIGGGIAGIQAALDIANHGRRVYIVEKNPSLGGIVAQLDNIPQTHENSMHLLESKLVECSRHPNVEILAYSEVKEIEGGPGKFKVIIERKPRYVREEKCNGCDLCSQVCRIKVPNEFDQHLSARKAIYIPFPQAVPLIYTIDKEHCINCGMCKIVCGRDAIDYDMEAEEIEIDVGSIIVATGGEYYEPVEYGYGDYPNVLTSLEFERLLSVYGPTRGRLIRPSDGKPVYKLAFVQCVGRNAIKYCSKICCETTIKEAASAKKNGVEEVTVFYTDIHPSSRNFEDYYIRMKSEHDIDYIKAMPREINQKEDGGLIIKYDSGEIEADLLILSTGLLPSKSNVELSAKLEIPLDKHGFIGPPAPDQSPILTDKPSVFACGWSTGARDIAEVVSQASGAALKTSLWVAPTAEEIKEEEYEYEDEEPRVGVFVCNCGVNISPYLNVPSLAEYAKTLPNVVHAEYNAYTCPAESIQKIKNTIEEHKLNRLVVASCACCNFEDLICSTCNYQKVRCKRSILNAWTSPYLPEFVNLREQCPWVHMADYEKATRKAMDIIRTAVTKVKLVEPERRKTVDIYPAALVIGGGVSGVAAALNLSYHGGFAVHLVERNKELSGEGLLNGPLEKEKNIVIHTESNIKDISGYVGNFEATLDKKGKEEKINAGVIIIASEDSEDSKRLARLLKLPVYENGLFLEAHPKFRPLEVETDGIFLCNPSASISDSITQGLGAASKAVCILSKESVKIKTMAVEVDQEKCIGCGVCAGLCSVGAVIMEDYKAKIIEVLCRGCGSCIVGCPERAITSPQFKDEYYFAQIAELVGGGEA